MITCLESCNELMRFAWIDEPHGSQGIRRAPRIALDDEAWCTFFDVQTITERGIGCDGADAMLGLGPRNVGREARCLAAPYRSALGRPPALHQD